MRAKLFILCLLMAAQSSPGQEALAPDFTLGIGNMSLQNGEVHVQVLATSPQRLKAARFMVQYDSTQMRILRIVQAQPSQNWDLPQPQILPNGRVFFLLRRSLNHSVVIPSNAVIANLVFQEIVAAPHQVTLVSDVTAGLPHFVILNSGPQDQSVTPALNNTGEVALEIAEYRRERERVVFSAQIDARLEMHKIKFVLDYDGDALALPEEGEAGVFPGSGLHATDFQLRIDPTPAVPPAAWANQNVEIEIESPSGQTLAGQNLEIAVIGFFWRDTLQPPRVEVNRECGAGYFLVEAERGQLQRRCLDGQIATEAANAVAVNVPSAFALLQSYPNPLFISGAGPRGATIRFAVPRPEKISIAVYNVLGQLVKTLYDQTAFAGYHHVMWPGDNANGEPARAGLYFVRLRAGKFTQINRLLMLR